MPLLLIAIALIAPRVLVFVLWLLTTWFQGVFHTLLWPLLGFLFMPTTLLWYSAVQHWFGGHWGPWPVAGIVVAILIDLSPASGRRR